MLIGLSIIFLIKFVPKPKVSGKNNPVTPHIIPAIMGSKYTGILFGIGSFPVKPLIYKVAISPAKSPKRANGKISYIFDISR